MAGLKLKPAERWELGLGLTWTSADAALDPFSLPADDYVATHPSMSFDFSHAHTYSDLDTTRIEGELTATYHINKTFWINAGYRYADFSDDAPYMYDTSGSISLYSLALGWNF